MFALLSIHPATPDAYHPHVAVTTMCDTSTIRISPLDIIMPAALDITPVKTRVVDVQDRPDPPIFFLQCDSRPALQRRHFFQPTERMCREIRATTNRQRV
jgi:hypothetical protein